MTERSLMTPELYRHELHLHTCYSFLDGASQPDDLIARAKELGYQSLAVTDHDGLYGAMAFAKACDEAGIQPITGVELTLRHGLVDATLEHVHVTLLAESERGYNNLCRLVTKAHRSSPKKAARAPGESATLDPAFLTGHTDGIIILSGCRVGEVTRLIDAGRMDDAARSLERLVDLFGRDNVMVELQQNLVRGDTARIARQVALARRLDLPIVATGNVHYHERARHRLQDAMVAIRHRTTLEASHRQRRPNSEFYLRTPAEVSQLFAAYPEAIANAARISQRCAGFNLARRGSLGRLFPDFIRASHEQGATDDEVLATYCWKCFAERYSEDKAASELRDKARTQLETELILVAKHELSGFFLIYRDLQQLATDVAQRVRGPGTIRGGSGLPPGRGRGSAVSSIICYLIGLSHVDPVKNSLFFSRFINEDLTTVPDIDLDFARDIRAALILAVYEQYGHDHAALVCIYATYHLRSAVRDLGKVLGLPATAIDKLAKLSEGGGADAVGKELNRLPEFAGQSEGPVWRLLMELAEQIDAFPRHVGQHVGGMIILSRPVIDLVPVQPGGMEGRFICQWDKDSCDDAGFIKIDFLALGMLSLVEECLEHIWHTRGERVDLGGDVDYADPKVFDSISIGDTVGLFQVESRAQIQMLPRTQPRTLNDLAVQVAIVRPGPIVGGAVNPYVRRRELLRQNPNAVIHADHQLLDGLLRDTLGVILYQDQVLEVAVHIGNFTPGQADQFRRAMSRRRSDAAMERFRESFLIGARENKLTDEEAEEMFRKLAGFSEFGFPKSHAYAFATLAYQSAWLRYYFPSEYVASLLNNQPMGFYSPHVLVGDAKRHGIRILRIAINSSGVNATPGKDQVRLGLTTIRGLGKDQAQAIVADRDTHGRFTSLTDLLQRTRLPRQIAENLIAVGALGEFGLSRRELLWQLGLLLPQELMNGQSRTRVDRERQSALPLSTEQDMVHLPDMNEWERMVADYGLLQLSPSYHPLALLRDRLPKNLMTAAQLLNATDGRWVRTVGLVVCRQRPGTAKGIVFLLIEDETGLTNVVVSSDLYEARRVVVRSEPYLCVEGLLQIRSGSLNVLARRITSLSQVPGQMLPQPSMRHPYPGGHHDPREVAAIEAAKVITPAAKQPAAPLAAPDNLHRDLSLVAPRSHNFH